MKKYLLSLIVAFAALSASAQGSTFQPTTWNISIDKIKGNLYDVALRPTFVEEGWHVYDFGPYEYGANPTVITIKGNVKVVGEPTIEGVEIEMDDILGFEIGTCPEGSVFHQTIEAVSESPVEITVSVEFECCKEGYCIFLTEKELVATVPAAKTGDLRKRVTGFLTADKTVLAIIISVLVLLGLYLIKIIRFKKDSKEEHISAWRLLLAIVVFALVIYFLPYMW